MSQESGEIGSGSSAISLKDDEWPGDVKMASPHEFVRSEAQSGVFPQPASTSDPGPEDGQEDSSASYSTREFPRSEVRSGVSPQAASVSASQPEDEHEEEEDCYSIASSRSREFAQSNQQEEDGEDDSIAFTQARKSAESEAQSGVFPQPASTSDPGPEDGQEDSSASYSTIQQGSFLDQRYGAAFLLRQHQLALPSQKMSMKMKKTAAA
ncbi:hypothetical protein HGRIS_001277 [Hohenbuehelia grisea]|uniref:Uncharacterized protein n=1 Tax=Hohenbuehelia grisea TaxID=104357 RepID=A0ABR3JNV4_9AGAR